MFFGGFPFGDMHDGPMRGRSKKDVDTQKFYDLLGIDKNSSVADIKKAYRKLAIKHHPDKGGDPEMFKEISRAYEVLSDPEKRKTYDEYGEEGLEGTGAADPTDIFDLFFGGGGRRRPQGKKKGEDIESPIKVTLEQLYNGATRKMAISKDVICDKCEGHGGPKDSIVECNLCHGTGVRVHIRQMGPMIQQTQAPCNSCRQGKVIPEGKRCANCNGVGTCKERKVLEVFIEKGAPDGHRIVFSGEADEKPDTIPGDVRFVVDQQEHPIFKRRGANLILKKEITLFEALTGFKFVIEQLDGRQLLIKSKAGEVTNPGAVKIVREEGMPVHKNQFEKGHLFIEFDIKMPTSQEMAMKGSFLKDHLKKVLPCPPALKLSGAEQDYEQHAVEDVTPEDYNARQASRNEAYCEDDDGMRGGQRVQCHQQ